MVHHREAGRLMEAEISDQVSVLRGILVDGIQEISNIARAVGPLNGRLLTFSGRGSSGNAARYAAYLAEVALGVPTSFASPSVTTVFQRRMDQRHVVHIVASQSGRSTDLIETLTAAREQGAVTIALTNDPSSPLAQAAHFSADLRARPESAVAATKSYTAELLAYYLLLDCWRTTGPRGVGNLLDAIEAASDLSWPEVLASRLISASRVILTARGFGLATAREAALKVTETTALSTHALSAAELMHGPIAMAGPQTAVVTIGPGTDEAAQAARDRGSQVHRLSHHADGPDALVLPIANNAELAPLSEIIPLQRAAYLLAIARGEDPDVPYGLTKVTATR